jgi:hypothetical protein
MLTAAATQVWMLLSPEFIRAAGLMTHRVTVAGEQTTTSRFMFSNIVVSSTVT